MRAILLASAIASAPKCHERRARKYLIPFFGKKGLSEITGVNEYRMHRIADAQERWGKARPS